ncbi:MAG: ATP-dependent Clp protease ATP-binding subunit ClpA, partial [Alphaproteobacteria bacterium]|nr:ATP-dependent Clp protease ATP-binding subunit ClpA [Alphaproteobacteria bacterium]
DDEEAINRIFTPEFRNRLDAIISFAPLSPATMGKIVDKFVIQLENQLADREVTIAVNTPARAWLAERGYDEKFGARPLARIIQDYLKRPLAEELLFGKLVKGGAVRVTVADEKLTFSYPKYKRKKPSRRVAAGAGKD